MNRGCYFIIGGGVLQQDFVDTVTDMGFETHVFDYDSKCPCAEKANVFHCVSIDAKDEILAIAKQIKPVAVQTAATELGNVTACYVGEKLSLNNNRYETALNTTDKSRMKKILSENNIPSANYKEVYSISAIDAQKIDYPVVVKPSDRSAARGVTKATEPCSFLAAFEVASSESQCGKVIIEECLEGRQYSVETITSHGVHHVVGITEETFDDTVNFIETRHMLPAILDSKESDQIVEIVMQTLNAFGVRFGAGHIELKMTSDGPKIIEVATRTGGLRDFMLKNALGCDFNRMVVESSLGQRIFVKYSELKYVVSVFLIRHSDYLLYEKIKRDSPEKIIRETNIKGFDLLSTPKTLMDSQGFFYLLFEREEDAVSIIRGEF
jgi:biotin carboxylase